MSMGPCTPLPPLNVTHTSLPLLWAKSLPRQDTFFLVCEFICAQTRRDSGTCLQGALFQSQVTNSEGFNSAARARRVTTVCSLFLNCRFPYIKVFVCARRVTTVLAGEAWGGSSLLLDPDSEAIHAQQMAIAGQHDVSKQHDLIQRLHNEIELSPYSLVASPGSLVLSLERRDWSRALKVCVFCDNCAVLRV
jgi:hypothetical protein